MKKGIVIILAVAVIGALGIYSKSHKDDSLAMPASGVTSTLGDNTNSSAAGSDTSDASTSYKDGTYTGDSENTIYGTVQVAAVISGGKITDIKFLQMPGPEGHSKEVTAFAESPLKQSTLNHQSAHIDFVSGATQTSEGYQLSLQSALDQAA
jgi:uncharacterized protein with FMN-binding domain